MKFNTNEIVKIKLTEYGRKILTNRGRSHPFQDEDGWSEWQLWDVMNVFGPYVYFGSPYKEIPFKSEIEICEGKR